MSTNSRNDYIIPIICGRLANNLFMIAHAYAKALDYNKRLVVCKNQVNYFNGVSNDDYPNNIFRKIDFIDEVPESKVVNPAQPSDTEPTAYSGYYQSERYFSKYSKLIKELFGPTPEFVDRIETELPMVFSNKITVIHVRRGDYLRLPNYHPTISPEYVYEAVKQIPQTDYYFIASDDIQWCKENINLPNKVFIEKYNSYESLWLLSLCHNFVISNSSFSWWAAYLSNNPDKKVIAPETWFGPEGPNQWEEIYCEGWIKLPTYFENGFIFPKIS